MRMLDEKARVFEEHRSLLEGLAYRMLGTRADARDVVQDTYLKWSEADEREIRNARAWLVTVCTRLAMDVMKSARVRRETYVGTWLPEPFVDERAPDPAAQAQVDDTVSVALMLALEKLSPAERAAFLLHEVFGYRFDEVATILGKTEAACRKLASRARVSVHSAKPRFQASAEEHQRLLDAFLQAAHAGELERLKALLAESVEFHSDGGGKAVAVLQVMRGVDAVARFFSRVWSSRGKAHASITAVTRWFNGMPGVLIYEGGSLTTALSIAVEDGRIRNIYTVRNPDKLTAFRDGAAADSS